MHCCQWEVCLLTVICKWFVLFALVFKSVTLSPVLSSVSTLCLCMEVTNKSEYIFGLKPHGFFSVLRILKHLSLQIVHVCQFPQVDKCFSFLVPSIFFTALSFLCLLLWIVFLMSSFLYVHFPNHSLVVSIPILITHIAFYFNDIIFHFWYV